MTEQEKRKNAIKEMEKIIDNSDCDDDACDFYSGNCWICEATRIYDAGYRKEKETAKEVLDRLEKYICDAIDDVYLINYVRNIFLRERNHFGVEVE